MSNTSLVFPNLIEFNGNFEEYIQAVYNVFKRDFIDTKPLYKNIIVSVRKYPEVDGMHRTFYHITHEGEDENNRIPDFRRMERIKYPRFVIDNNTHKDILIWKNKRGRDNRIVLFNEEESYVVILTDRQKYYMFVTAYYVEKEHRKRKLMKEYSEYIKTKTVQ